MAKRNSRASEISNHWTLHIEGCCACRDGRLGRQLRCKLLKSSAVALITITSNVRSPVPISSIVICTLHKKAPLLRLLLRSKFATEFFSTENGTGFGFAYLPNFAIELYQPHTWLLIHRQIPPSEKESLLTLYPLLQLSPLYSPYFFRSTLLFSEKDSPCLE